MEDYKMYPTIDDDLFNIKIANHPNFRDYKYNKEFYISTEKLTPEAKLDMLKRRIIY